MGVLAALGSCRWSFTQSVTATVCKWISVWDWPNKEEHETADCFQYSFSYCRRCGKLNSETWYCHKMSWRGHVRSHRATDNSKGHNHHYLRDWVVWHVVKPFCFCDLFIFSRRESCNEGEGDPPLYVNVNMFSGEIMNTWIDSLQAFFPGLQVR